MPDVLNMFLRIFLLGIAIPLVYSQCSFPSSMVGSWIRADDKIEFMVTTNDISGFNYVFDVNTLNTFSCRESSGSSYLLHVSQYVAVFDSTFHIHLCFNVDILGPNSLLFTDLSNVSTRVTHLGNSANAFVDSSGIRTAVDVCTIDINQRAASVFYRKDIGSTPGAIAVTCPSLLFGDFAYVLDDTKCNGNSSLSVCIDRMSLRVDYSLCSDEVGYSAGGVMDCIGSVNRAGVTYLWTYNRDASVDDTNTYTTACFAIRGSSGGNVSMTSYPKNCEAGQDPATITLPGHKLNLSPIELCPILGSTTETPPPGGASTPAIAGGSAAAVIAIAVLVVIIVFLLLKRRNKRKTRISDATPTSNRSQTSRTAENGSVKKDPSSDKTTSSPPNAARKALPQNGGVSSAVVAPVTGVSGTTAVLATVNETSKPSISGRGNVQDVHKPDQPKIPPKESTVKTTDDIKAKDESKELQNDGRPETTVSATATGDSNLAETSSSGIDKDVDIAMATAPVVIAVVPEVPNKEHSASFVPTKHPSESSKEVHQDNPTTKKPENPQPKDKSEKRPQKDKSDKDESKKRMSEKKDERESEKGKSEETPDKEKPEKEKSEKTSDKGKSEKKEQSEERRSNKTETEKSQENNERKSEKKKKKTKSKKSKK